MRFCYEQIKNIIGRILWVFMWVAALALNIVAYVKENQWVSIIFIVLCIIWLIIGIVSIVIAFSDLKKFCDKYDEQVKKLCEAAHVTIMEE